MTRDRIIERFVTLFFLATECHAQRIDGIVYTPKQLIELCKPLLLPMGRPENPEKPRRM